MLREHLHRVVDEVFDVLRALLGDEHAALACSHVWGAHREMLLALRAVVEGTLTCFDEKPGGQPLVRVEVEGEAARWPANFDEKPGGQPLVRVEVEGEAARWP